MKYRLDNRKLQDMGPWLVQANDSGSLIVQEHTHTESYAVDEAGQKCRWSTYTEAKALLLAAAPGLLDALEKIIELNRQWALDQYGDATKAEQMECVRVARAAIAKATGEKI